MIAKNLASTFFRGGRGKAGNLARNFSFAPKLFDQDSFDGNGLPEDNLPDLFDEPENAVQPLGQQQFPLAQFQEFPKALVPFQPKPSALELFKDPLKSIVPFSQPQLARDEEAEDELLPPLEEEDELLPDLEDETVEPDNELVKIGNSVFRKEFLLPGNSGDNSQDSQEDEDAEFAKDTADSVADDLVPGLGSLRSLFKLMSADKREDIADASTSFLAGLLPIPGSGTLGRKLGKKAKEKSLQNQLKELEQGQFREISRDGEPFDRVVGSQEDLDREIIAKERDDDFNSFF